MIDKINQLKNKKGFTFIELIVVFAIIGIMLAILVPLISTNRALEDEIKDYAKAFYSNAQELLMDEKVLKNPLPGNGTNLGDISAYSVISVTVYDSNSGADPVIKMGKIDEVGSLTTVNPADTTDKWSEFATSLKKLEKYNGRDLYYTIIVDSKYRVKKVYCSLKECSDIWNQAFTASYYVGSDKVLTASYPRAYCEEKSDGTFPVFGAWDD